MLRNLIRFLRRRATSEHLLIVAVLKVAARQKIHDRCQNSLFGDPDTGAEILESLLDELREMLSDHGRQRLDEYTRQLPDPYTYDPLDDNWMDYIQETRSVIQRVHHQ